MTSALPPQFSRRCSVTTTVLRVPGAALSPSAQVPTSSRRQSMPCGLSCPACTSVSRWLRPLIPATLRAIHAESVAAALGAMGVATSRISTRGYGESYPVADNGTETNRALNRRVEVYISDNDQPVRARG